MPKWKRVLYHFAPFLALTTIGLYWLYFALRIRFIISAQRKQAHPFPLAWVFVGIEMSIAVPIFLHSFWSIFILKKRHRPKLRMVGNEVPTVDVFITCCNEDDDLILDTVRAACDLDYPQDRYRIMLLDDGKSDNIKDIINDMRSMHPNLYYRRRPKWPGVPHHFKAGNLNYGMEQVHKLPGGASEYLAGLDCDMIPEREWLRAIVPHILNDDKMALACPPQVSQKPSSAISSALTITAVVLQCTSRRSALPESRFLRSRFRTNQRCLGCSLVYGIWLCGPKNSS